MQVVNAPLKAAVRKARCETIYRYMQDFRMRWFRQEALKKPPAIYNPPKPTREWALNTLIKVCATTLATPEFRASLAKCFVTVGLRRCEDGGYVNFTGRVVSLVGHVKSELLHGMQSSVLKDFSLCELVDAPEFESK